MTDNDTTTLNSIINDISENLMIEAGAGTGKTYALVSRVVALIKSGVRMQEIVAITFTEAAAAELSERIRSRLEQLADRDNPDNENDLLATDLDEICPGADRRGHRRTRPGHYSDNSRIRLAVTEGPPP